MNISLQELQDRFEQLVAQDPLPLPPPEVPAPAPAAPPAPPLGAAKPSGEAGPQVQATDFAARGVNLDVRLRPSQVIAAVQLLRDKGFALDAVTGVDWMAQEEMEVVYDFFHPDASCRVAVRARVPRAQPEIATISTIFDGANWHERETHEFFGIKFLGHPYLVPLLLPEDATFHPLRKDFTGE
ncbi:MAG: NADH-quinone oxidoreductase subunit C [bacterium]